MKKTMPINNLRDLEKELARLRRRASANEAAMTQQWALFRRNSARLCWNSFRGKFVSNLLKSVPGRDTGDLVNSALKEGIEWIIGKFRKPGK